MPAKPRRNRDVLPTVSAHHSPTARSGRAMALPKRKHPQTASTVEPVGTSPARIEVTGLTKRFLTPAGSPFTALKNVSFTVEPGQFCAIVGPTGCGKSTTLGQISGLDRPSAGTVRVGGRDVRGETQG